MGIIYKKTSNVRFSLFINIEIINDSKAIKKVKLNLKSISLSLKTERKNIKTKRLDSVSDNPEVLNTVIKGVNDNKMIKIDIEKLVSFCLVHLIVNNNIKIETNKFKMKILL